MNLRRNDGIPVDLGVLTRVLKSGRALISLHGLSGHDLEFSIGFRNHVCLDVSLKM